MSRSRDSLTITSIHAWPPAARGKLEMSIHRRFALILAILWLWPGSLYAQSETLMEAFRQGQTLYEAGQYEQAIPLWRKALELGEQEFGPNHPTTAILINNLALLYFNQGRYAEAEPLYERALAARLRELLPDCDVESGYLEFARPPDRSVPWPEHGRSARAVNSGAGFSMALRPAVEARGSRLEA
jgi:tetratricopeptide (TPR) repeat protein